MPGTRHLVGLAPDRATIGRAVEELEAIGVERPRIGVVLRADPAQPLPDAGVETRPDADDAAMTGGVVGAAAGAGLTGTLAVAALTLSGVGVLAAGPLAGVLAAAASGGVAGGLTGAMIGVGIPEDVARRFDTRLRRGAALIAAPVDDVERDEVARALLDAGVRDLRDATPRDATSIDARSTAT